MEPFPLAQVLPNICTPSLVTVCSSRVAVRHLPNVYFDPLRKLSGTCIRSSCTFALVRIAPSQWPDGSSGR